MNTKSGRRIAVSLLASFLAAFAAGAARAEKPTTTISGVVKRHEVHRDQVRSVVIRDSEQRVFLVVRGTAVGKELVTRVGATVKATGYVRKAQPSTGYTHLIDVLEYEVVDTAVKASPDSPAEPQ